MYSEKIENLINLALADGELTEKEKQVLFKNAEAEGIDLDEFEMVLEARLYEKQQTLKTSTESSAAPKSEKFGDVRKCPACGAIVESFAIKCPDCGHNFRNIEANSSIQKLFELLNKAEDMRKGGASAEFLSGIVSHMLGPGKIDRKKMEIIKNFPIPTTKDDILEFLALAIPNATQKGNFLTKSHEDNKVHNSFVPVWKSKCEQIVLKARFSMKEDKTTLEEIEYYAKKLKI